MFQVSETWKAAYPDAAIGVLAMRDVANPEHHSALDERKAALEQALRDRHAGIDYQAVLAAAGRRWPFAEFVKQLAGHLGRKGGLAAFTTEELESLQKVYQRLTSLDAPMLREACEGATGRSIPDIVFLLQQLAHEKERKT